MSERYVFECSEECVLDRHGDCSGRAYVASTSSVSVTRPCACFCHGLAKP